MLYRVMLPLLLAAVFLTTGSTAQLPNLTYKIQSNWDYPIVVTTQYPATSPYTIPAVLPGNSLATFYNSLSWNDGPVATPTYVNNTSRLDGVIKADKEGTGESVQGGRIPAEQAVADPGPESRQRRSG